MSKRGEFLQPLPGCVSLFLFLSGGSLRSAPANFLSPRWGGEASEAEEWVDAIQGLPL